MKAIATMCLLIEGRTKTRQAKTFSIESSGIITEP